MPEQSEKPYKKPELVCVVQVADEAVAVLLEVIQAFSSQWESDIWQVVFTGALAYLFELPKSQLAADEDESAVVSLVLCEGELTASRLWIVASASSVL